MTTELQNFIETHIEQIDENLFQELYDSMRGEFGYWDISGFTKMLYEAGIDPLTYMHTVPKHFIVGDDSLVELIIPEGIELIDFEAVIACNNLKKVHLPYSLKRIDTSGFSGCYNIEELTILNPKLEVGAAALNVREFDSIYYNGTKNDFINNFSYLYAPHVYCTDGELENI